MEKKAGLVLNLVTGLVGLVSMAIAGYIVILPTYLSSIEMSEIYFWVILFSFHFVVLLTLSSFIARSNESRSTIVKVAYAGIFIFALLLGIIIVLSGPKGVLSYWGALSMINIIFSLFIMWFYNLEMIRDLFLS